MADFTHLHVHTEYSLLDGVNRIPALLEKVKSDGQRAIAMTDHGVLHGLAEFWMAAKDTGVKPIIGCEVYISPGPRHDRREVDGIKYYHLVLLAKNKTGFHNLIKLVSHGHLEGMYYRPRIDKELLKKYNDGLIVTSACLAGPLSTHIIRKEEKQLKEWLEFFNETFPSRFYLELQRNGYDGVDDPKRSFPEYDEDTKAFILQQMKVNTRLRELAVEYKLPLIATTDAHYLNQDDKSVQKILFCVKDGVAIDNPKAREGYVGTYVKTTDEMCQAFEDDITPLENTIRIADEVEEYDIVFDRVQPKYWNLPKTSSAQKELRIQTFDGAKRKYGKLTKELEERLTYELDIIHDKGYDDYLLVVSDIMKWSAKQGILTGVRGSVAGSVVAYCTDIVEIDPIGWELYFERFLNPERMSPPDIDLDIQDSRRDELIEYVKEKYGRESLAAIAAIGRFKTKAAIRDVARVMGLDLSLADKLSKRVNVVFGKVYTIDKQLKEDNEFKSWIEADPKLMELADHVRKIEGMARHMSVHACGYLITPDNITNFTPVQYETGGGERVVTQLEGPWMEEIGLMKFDFLGLRTLTILSNAIKNVKESKGIGIDPFNIPQNDTKTFELFSKGETTGIFQFESPPMRKYLKDLQPESLEDLCFMAAAYRPGPMKYIPDYIQCKHGKKAPEYLTPEMKPIVENTFGFAIYQEQVIKIAVDLAGYTMGQADMLRRAMGKKKMDIMKKEEPKFIQGAIKRGIDKKIANKLWEYLLPFADYGFNKAHSAGYAVLAYKCAYIKAHHPLEFMAALMHSDLNDPDRISIDIAEAKRMGYKVLPPDINKSYVDFTPEGKKGIRFGLGAVKNVGEQVCMGIVKAREKYGVFKSVDEVIKNVGSKSLSKKSLECLTMVGAMDTFGDRDGLLTVVPSIFERIASEEKHQASGQNSLFETLATQKKGESLITPIPEVKKSTQLDKARWEKDLLGMYISSHPLKRYEKIFEAAELLTPREALALPEGATVKIAGIVTDLKTITTKSGKPMAFFSVESLESQCSAVVFNRTFEEIKESLEDLSVWVFVGKTNTRNGEFSLIVDELNDINDYKNAAQKSKNIITLDISKESKVPKLERLKEVIVKNPGSTEIRIFYASKNGDRSRKDVTRAIQLNDEVMSIISEYMV